MDRHMDVEKESASCVSVAAWPSCTCQHCHTVSECVLAPAVYINDDNDDKASEGSGAHAAQ